MTGYWIPAETLLEWQEQKTLPPLAPFEMNVSIYNGSGAKETIPANIDLDAPNGEPLVEFKKIVDTTAKRLDKKLRKKLKLKK